MTSPVRVAVPVALMVFTMIVVYGALEMSDSGKSALDIIWDMMYGKKEKPVENENSQEMEISCMGSDQNGFYEMDEGRNCILKGCSTDYLQQNNACVKLATFIGNEAVDCEISGYTYGACTPKPNRRCGEGAGTREKYPIIEEFASGGGTCEYSTFEDCDIECPTTCGLKPEDYSAVDNALCIGVKSGDGESITLGVESGYCGEGTEQLQIIPGNISESVVQELGFETVQKYLEYANPNGVCRTTEPAGCNVSCDQTTSDGNPLENVGCDYNRSEYAYISDTEGKAVCFNSQSVNEYLNPTPGGGLNKPVPLETIIAKDIENDDLTYDMSKIDDDKKTGLYLLYRSSTDMSYDNLVKNKCHLYKTQPCDAPKESVDCVLGNSVPDTCDIFNGCGQSYSKTITRVLERQAFGDGKTCIQKYGESDYHGKTYRSTDNCQNADPCCEDSDYKPVEGTCNSEGIQTFRLDDDNCEKTNLLGDVSYESPEEVTRLCKVNCEMNDWTDVTGTCNQDPNRPGKKQQTRTVKTEPQNGGEACPTDRVQYLDCDVDCVGDWSNPWSACSKTCGTGTQTKTWKVTSAALNGGTCVEEGTTQSQDCNTQACPVNCVGDWSNPWSGCSEDCGPGTQTKTWKVTTAAQHGGTCVNEGTTKRQDCKIKECPVPCVGDWSNPWSACSKTCGTGTQTKTWKVTSAAQHGGTCANEGTTKRQNCNTQACPVPAVCGWTNTGGCSVSSGKQTQTRTTTTAAKHGGTACGSETQEIACTPTGFDNERVYIKDPFGGYLGQSKSNKWLHHADYQQPNRYTGIYESRVDKTYFTLDGSFDNVTIKGGVNDKYCANSVCDKDSPDDFVYAHISSMKVNGYFKFEKQSDGGFKIYPKYHDGTRTRRFIYRKSKDRIYTLPGTSMTSDDYDVFYLEAA